MMMVFHGAKPKIEAIKYQNTIYQLYFFTRNMVGIGALSIQTPAFAKLLQAMPKFR
jgi:hypothetical protein